MRKMSRTKLAVLKKRETETWIYSYSDLITNLLALFVMLLIVLSGSQKARDKLTEGIESYVKSKQQLATGFVGTGASQVDDLRIVVSASLKKLGLTDRVSVSPSRNGVELTFASALLFESGTAVISEPAQLILDAVTDLVANLPTKVVVDVEGHADNRPVTSGRYPSNWELSSARAGSVVRFMEERGVAGKKLRAIGFGSTRPVGGDPAAEANRRVVIRIDTQQGGD